MPTVPTAVWEQIGVVVIFSFLLAGLGMLLVRFFTSAIADVNKHYAEIIQQNNMQWQQYFDAKSTSNQLIDNQIIQNLGNLTEAIQDLSKRHDEHDTMVRGALDAMATKRKKLSTK